jgi:hypothetical protein
LRAGTGRASKRARETEFPAARGEKTVEPNLAKNIDSLNPPANEMRPGKTKSAESSAHKFPSSSRHTEHKTQAMLVDLEKSKQVKTVSTRLDPKPDFPLKTNGFRFNPKRSSYFLHYLIVKIKKLFTTH